MFAGLEKTDRVGDEGVCGYVSERRVLGVRVPPALPGIKKGLFMAKRKVSRKYRKKAMMERQMQERKVPPSQPKKKMDWKQFIKRLPSRIAKFFKDVVRELKRVSWPTKKALLNYTIVVIVTIIIFAVILGVFDFGFIHLLDLIVKI
jgi:preprotein translocase subunit SecE